MLLYAFRTTIQSSLIIYKKLNIWKKLFKEKFALFIQFKKYLLSAYQACIVWGIKKTKVVKTMSLLKGV